MRMEVGWVVLNLPQLPKGEGSWCNPYSGTNDPFPFGQCELTALAGNEQLRTGGRCGVCRHRDRCGSDQNEVSNEADD